MKKIVLILCLFFVLTKSQAREFLSDSISFLALGDSYTIGHSVDSTERWPVQLLDSLRINGKEVTDLEIRAVTGWSTSVLLSNLRNNPIDKKYSDVSLLIGVNNFYQGIDESIYIDEFNILLDSAISYCSRGDSGVFVVSIPDYGYTPFGSTNQAAISAQTDRYNFIGDSIATARNIEFINITDISRRWTSDPDLVAVDQLHPSGKQYLLWVNRILGGITTSIQSRVVKDPSFIRKVGQVFLFKKSGVVRVISSDGKRLFRKKVREGEELRLSKYRGKILDFRYRGGQGVGVITYQ